MRKSVSGIVAVILIGYTFFYISLSQAATTVGPKKENTTESIRRLEDASRLNEVAHLIKYYDEVLTQSARNYAFTQDKKWLLRYQEIEPKLDATLKEALEKGDRADKLFLKEIDTANLKLMEMEYRSIEFVKSGQRQQALDILESGQYWKHKEIYFQSLEGYVQRRSELSRTLPLEDLKQLNDKWMSLPDNAGKKEIQLTDKEHAWLAEHPIIRLGFHKDWEPAIIIDEDGKLSGFLIDFFDQLNRKLGTNIVIETGAWPDIVQRARNLEIEGIAGCATIQAEANRLLSTRTHFINYVTVFVQADDPNEIKSFKDLEGRTVSYVKGFKFAEILLKPFQDKIKVIETQSTLEAMKLVLEGKAGAVVGLNMDNYLIARHILPGIKAGFIDINHPLLAVTAIRNDWPELVGILNKGIDSLGQVEINEIAAKWINLSTPTQTIKLTEDERAWLEAHPLIRVAADIRWAPVEFVDEDGEFKGISIDYLKQLSELLGVEFQFKKNVIWQEVMKAVETREMDMFSSLTRTPERDVRYNFTTPYLSIPINIFAGGDVTYIGNLNALEGKRVAVVEGYAIHEWLQSNHPEIKLVTAKSIPSALKMLAERKVYAFVGNVVTTSYYISQLGLNQIKVAGETPYKNDQSMAVRKDWSILADILQKALDAISQSERDAIFNRWVSIKYEHGFDYSLLWKILAPAFLVFMLFIYWNRRLRREVSQRVQAEAELKLDEERLEALLKLGQIKDVDEEQLLEYALEECVRLTNSQIGYLHFVHPDQKNLGLQTWSKNTRKYCKAEKNPHFPIAEAGIWADCVREKEPVVHNDYPNHPNRRDLPEGHVPLNRYLSIPVVDGDKIVMVAGVGNKENPYMDSDVRQLTLFMQNMWVIIKEKRIEEKLQFTQFAIDRASDAAFWIGPDARFVYVNDAACRSLGYLKEELMTMTVHDIDESFPKERWSKQWEEMADRRFMNIESEFKTKDDQLFPVEITTNYVVFGGKEYIVAFTRDVTDRKKSEEELRFQKSFFETLIENSPEAIVIGDETGRISRVNSEFTRMFGYKAEEAEAQNLNDLVAPPDRLDDAVSLDRLASKGETTRLETVRKRKDGSLLDVSVMGAPITQNGNTIAIFFIYRDITERKKSENEQKQNIDSLERFNKLATGQEKRIIKLKQAINKMLKEQGLESKYKSIE